ncbi:D-alanyl-D-alanine carboxypeptidase family protein [Candidatus Saccharibacteria bacterium]|nr:D-alanyl-D-alanine carboxypeptidase family protein [Candidatus Saccharibacteria bacterium]
MYIRIAKVTMVMALVAAFLLVAAMLAYATNSPIGQDGQEELDDTITTEAETEAEEETLSEPEDPFAKYLNPERNYLILVNKEHEYEFGGWYDQLLQDDLIQVSDNYEEPTYVENATHLAFGMLQTKLWNEYGILIWLYSAYRTEADQQWVHDNFGTIEGWNTVAEPGHSEHHTGLMINFLVWHNNEWYTETAERQQEDDFYTPIRATLADYGFIERYPAGKEDITGVACEPYEIRFVGSSKIAHEIMDNNLCLEEYLDE